MPRQVFHYSAQLLSQAPMFEINKLLHVVHQGSPSGRGAHMYKVANVASSVRHLTWVTRATTQDGYIQAVAIP
jgi:hypothetical protein